MQLDYKVNEAGYASALFMRISQEKRQRIVSTAVREFAALGFASANVNRIAEQARDEGIADLRTSGLRKVRAGVTSLAEIDRITRD